MEPPVRQVIDTVRGLRQGLQGRELPAVGDPPVLTADAAKARTELGWTPRFGNLKTIVRTAWTWHSNYPDGYPE